MTKNRAVTLFQKILVPVVYGCDHETALLAARAIVNDEAINLIGMIFIPDNESLSTAAVMARDVRRILKEISKGRRLRRVERVHVSHRPWDELIKIVEAEQPDLLLLSWPCHFESLHITPADVFLNPPCDIAVVGGPISNHFKRVLVPMRGGPYAELALRISLSVARTSQANVTALHVIPTNLKSGNDAPFRGVNRVLRNLPDVTRQDIRTDDHVRAILDLSREFDLVVMGASARQDTEQPSLGSVAEQILRESQRAVIVVKTCRPMPVNLESEEAGQTAISVLVDKWFAENSYSADEFDELDYLLALKRKQNLSISLALPALNEEETIGNVIQTVKDALVVRVPLLDEIVLIDSNSVDRTRSIAKKLNIPTYIHQSTLPQYGVRHGKGEALWKSLYLTRGDIILWIDTDIVNIHPRFVYGLLGPLLLRPDIQFVKGFYRRPLKVGDKIQAGSGGRVTELTARPLLNLFYPELSGVIQPLSGEYGGRRTVLEQLPFFSGYGVEIGLLIDVFEKFGLKSIAQVDLRERIHHNQPLEALSKMSFAIIQAVIRKLERRYDKNFLEDVNKTMKLIRYESDRFRLEIEEIAERERPPMLEIHEYGDRAKRRIKS
jgi:glucosyl-3-phosphoglycerate synthase